MERIFNLFIAIAFILALSGCKLSDEDKEKLDSAAVDLQQLADQIKILNPANGAEVLDSRVDVRAYIPEDADVSDVTLYVDGIKVATDTDGEPWEINWPAYYWADGKLHTLLLTAMTGQGNVVNNIQETSVRVNTSANAALSFEGSVNGKSIQDQNALNISFTPFESATGYEILIDEELITTDSTELTLNNLTVGAHTVRYRALHERLKSTPFSEEATFEVLPPAVPVLNDPVIEKKADGYEVTLSWESVMEGDSFTVFYGKTSEGGATLEQRATMEHSLKISGLATSRYEWKLQRTNKLGQSVTSQNSPIYAGVFERKIGDGIGNAYGKSIITSKDGGYIILGVSA
ncbi:MAG: Ig-like domain-containing protein, partial [Oleispira sp.]|nr:Ig-like domain-containing protein [Oleispira sp.]